MACQRCGSRIPAEARACPTCGLAAPTAQSDADDFDSAYPSVAGYMPLYTTLPDGAPGNAPAFWVPFPMNVGTTDAPRYSAGIPRERLTTEPLTHLPDGTSPRHRAAPKPPRARRHMHWLALVFGILLAALLVMAFALAVVFGGANSAAGLQLTGVMAYILASVLAAIGVLANGFSRWNARRREHEGYGPHAPAE